MRMRRETIAHPFGTIKMRIGATHFLMKTLPKIAIEMALRGLAHDLIRELHIMGDEPIMVADRA
jgi:transposase